MVRRTHWMVLFGMMVASGLFDMACRPSEPPDAYPEDLGDENAILVPTSSAFEQPGIADGRADWVDFRAPEDEAPANAEANSAETEGKSDSSAEDAEIRQAITDYNGLVDDQDASVDDLLTYFVESQQEAIRPVLERTATFEETLGELRDALKEKKPDETDRIDSVVGVLQSTIQRKLTATAIKVNDDGSVTVTLSAGPFAPTCRFVVVEDEWFIELPNVSSLKTAESALDNAMSTYQSWLTELTDGSGSADDVLQKMADAADAARRKSDPHNTDDESGG